MLTVRDVVGEMVTWYRDGYLDPGVWEHITDKINPSALPTPAELPAIQLQYPMGGYPQLGYTRRHVVEETLALPFHTQPDVMQTLCPQFSALQIAAPPAPPGGETCGIPILPAAPAHPGAMSLVPLAAPPGGVLPVPPAAPHGGVLPVPPAASPGGVLPVPPATPSGADMEQLDMQSGANLPVGETNVTSSKGKCRVYSVRKAILYHGVSCY